MVSPEFLTPALCCKATTIEHAIFISEGNLAQLRFLTQLPLSGLGLSRRPYVMTVVRTSVMSAYIHGLSAVISTSSFMANSMEQFSVEDYSRTHHVSIYTERGACQCAMRYPPFSLVWPVDCQSGASGQIVDIIWRCRSSRTRHHTTAEKQSGRLTGWYRCYHSTADRRTQSTEDAEIDCISRLLLDF
jgi:hypothetical protein